MSNEIEELEAIDGVRDCIASEEPELLVNVLLNRGDTHIDEYPCYIDENSRFFMVRLRDKSTGAAIDLSNLAPQDMKPVFFANPEKFKKGEHKLGALVPVVRDHNVREYLGCRSPEPLLWLLLDMGLEASDIRHCELRKDVGDHFYIIRISDIAGLEIRIPEIATRLHRDQSIFFVEPARCKPITEDCMGDVITNLSPIEDTRGHSYATLIFWCVGDGRFRQVLDTLFSLGVKPIQSAKLQLGNNQIFLIRAAEIASPLVLSKFGYAPKLDQKSDVRIFYPSPSSADVWIEWGWYYQLPEASYHSIFSPGANQTVFLFNGGQKIALEKPRFYRLLRFMNLNFDSKTTFQLEIADPKTIEENKFECKLRLTSNIWRNRGKQELEDLIREERKIKERIQWLRDMDGVFESNPIHRVQFYPLGQDRDNDPAFPQHFFRHHSLVQLRKLHFFYGNVGVLGDGVLVCDKHLVKNPQSIGYQVNEQAYPRSQQGIVFESCGDWLTLAGLRVLRPLGFDLFPYLEIDRDDRDKIVNAFLDRVFHYNPGSTERFNIDIADRKDIEAHPEKYLYFLFPPSDAATDDLEGLIIHEEKFKDFDVKIANLGVHFSRTDDEKEIANKEFDGTVVKQFEARFRENTKVIRGTLQQAFQKERKELRTVIKKFSKNVTTKQKSLKKWLIQIDERLAAIKEKESTIDKYDRFLSNSIKKYGELTTDLSSQFSKFSKEHANILIQMTSDVDNMVKKNLETLKNESVEMSAIESSLAITLRSIGKLAEKRSAYLRSRLSLRAANKELAGYLRGASNTAIDEEVKSIWGVNDAFKQISSDLELIERHVKLVNETAGPDFSGFSGQQQRWMHGILTKLYELNKELPKFLGTTHAQEAIYQHFENLDGAVDIIRSALSEPGSTQFNQDSLEKYRLSLGEVLEESESRLLALTKINSVSNKRSFWTRLLNK